MNDEVDPVGVGGAASVVVSEPRDAAHERAHETIKDILAGRVTQPTRRRLQEALKDAPRDAAPAKDFTRINEEARRRAGRRL
jgi:hypothetical protein